MTIQASNFATSYWAYKDDNSIPYEANSDEKAIKLKIKKLIDSIKYLLSDSNQNSIKESFFNLFDDVLSLRLQSLQLINKKETDIKELFSSIYDSFENRELPERLDYLNENVLFSLRTTSKIANNVFTDLDNTAVFNSLTNFPIANNNSEVDVGLYRTLARSLKIISQQLPNNALLKIFSLINKSLFTELGIISADIIFESKNEVEFSDSVISELNELIVESAQEYGALANELGLIKNTKKEYSNDLYGTDESQDYLLAEEGLSEYLKSISVDDD